MQKTVINRPWLTSFMFNGAQLSATKLEQVHKLSRNFVASLDLGCPSATPVKRYATQREAYKAWVADWKRVYAGVSTLIRAHKIYRRTTRPIPLTALEQAEIAKLCGNHSPQAYLNSLSAVHLPRLQETAQVLLNARYNAKLAAAEARRREMAATPAVETQKAA